MGNFTDTYIRNIKSKDKRFEEYEGGGFGIRVSPNLKSWIYRYKIDGKTDKITLGHYPEMSLAMARTKFIELKSLKRSGQTPKIVLQQNNAKKNNNVALFIESWYQNYVAKNRKQPLQIKKQIKADIIPSLGHFELEELKPLDVANALDIIVNRGSPVHANRVLSTLKQAFNYAVSRGAMTHNPASNIRARDIGGLEKPRERYLSLDELRTIWLFLDSEQSRISLQIKYAIKIIILTGVRSGEIRLAEWSHFDFDKALWTIPAELTKGANIVRIHLTEMTRNILLELKAISHSNFVLPGLNLGKPLDVHTLPRAILRIQDRVGIPSWTAHDLRRTFATQLGESLRIDPVVIEKCLGHKMPRIMATYNKDEMLPQRKEALEQWAICIKNFLNHEKNLEVSELSGIVG